MFTFPVGFFGGSTGDPFWSNVVLLVPGDGTNGATVIPDVSSSPPKTVTTVGNAQISTTRSKFGPSSIFSNTTGYLTASDATLNLSGLNAFTVECWIWLPSTFGTTNFDFIGTRLGGNRGTFLLRGSLSTIILFASSGGALWEIQIPSLSPPPSEQWIYLAATKSGNNYSFWINGVLQGTATSAVPLASQSAWGIFAAPDGTNRSNTVYMDDIRITRNIARDVSVVPAAPFPIG